MKERIETISFETDGTQRESRNIMKKKNSQKRHPLLATNGITLIALVITIIILLILAGVAIASLTGDNGLLGRTADVKEKASNSEIEDRIKLAYHAAFLDGQGKVSETALETELKTEFGKTDLDEGWLDKTSVTGKWRVTIDEVTTEVPAGTESSNPPDSPVNVLMGKQKKDIYLNPSIPITETTNAKFYDCNINFTSNGFLDDYIAYNDVIYKISYNVDNKEAESLLEEARVVSITDIDIDISTLGKSGENITSILYGTKPIVEIDNINGTVSYFVEVENCLGSRTCLIPYDEQGALNRYPYMGDYMDYDEHGYDTYYWFIF